MLRKCNACDGVVASRLEKSNLQEKSRSSRPELFLEIGSPEVWRDGQDNLQGWESVRDGMMWAWSKIHFESQKL